MALPDRTTLRSYPGSATPAYLVSTLDGYYTPGQTFTLSTTLDWYEVSVSGTSTTNPLGTSGVFTLVVDYGSPSEEKILCSGVISIGANTVVHVYYDGISDGRGYDGTPTFVHSVGSTTNYNVFPVATAVEQLQFNQTVAAAVISGSSAGGDLSGYYPNPRLSASVSGTIYTNQSNIAALSGSVSSISGSLSTVSGVAYTTQNNLATLSGNVSVISGAVVVLSGKIATLASGLYTVSGYLAQISGVLSTMSGQISTISGTVSTISGIAYTNQSNISTLSGNVGTISGEVTVLSGNISVISGALTTISGVTYTNQSDLATLSGNVSTISGQVTTNTNAIATQSGQISTISGTLSTTVSNLATLSGNVSTISGQVSTNTNTIATQSGQISTISGQVSTNTNQIATQSGQISTISGSLSTTVSNLATLSGNVSSISGSLSTVSGVAYTNQSNLSTLSGNVSTISGQVSTNTTVIATQSGQISTISGSLSNTITSLSGYARLNGSTFTGNVTFSGSAYYALVPSGNYDLVNKAYVDATAAGLNVHPSVYLSSVSGNLPSYVYVNGTADQSGGLGIGAVLSGTAPGVPVVDGITIHSGERILVKHFTGAAAIGNGAYTVTQSGSSTPGNYWLMTRATDTNNSIAGQVGPGDIFFVSSGQTQAATSWVQVAVGSGTDGTIILGSDGLAFSQFSGPGQYQAGNGLQLTGAVFSVLTANAADITVAAGGIDLANTGTPGTYGTASTVSSITTDSKGRVTSISGVNIQITEGQVTNLTSDLSTISGQIGTISGSLSTVSGIAYTNKSNISTISGVTYTNQTNISTLSGYVSTISGQSGTNTSNIAALSGSVSSISGSLATVSGITYTNQSNLAALSGSVSSISGSLSTVSGIAYTAQSNIAALSGSVSSISGTVSTISGIAYTNQTNLATLSGSVSSISGSLSTVSGIAYANQSDIATLSGSLSSISGSLSTISGIAYTNQNDIATLSGYVSTISGVAGNALPITGGTIVGDLTISGTTTISGSLDIYSSTVGGVAANSYDVLTYNGSQWIPAASSAGTPNYVLRQQTVSSSGLSNPYYVVSGAPAEADYTIKYYARVTTPSIGTSTVGVQFKYYDPSDLDSQLVYVGNSTSNNTRTGGIIEESITLRVASGTSVETYWNITSSDDSPYISWDLMVSDIQKTNVATVWAPDYAPTYIYPLVLGSGGVSLVWTDPTSGIIPTSYRITDTSGNNYGTIPTASGNVYNIYSSFVANASYTFQVTGSVDGNYGPVGTAQYAVSPNVSPNSIAFIYYANIVNSGSVEIGYYDAPQPPVIDGYYVYENVNNTIVGSGIPYDSPIYANEAYAVGTSYQFYLKAYNSAGTGPSSALSAPLMPNPPVYTGLYNSYENYKAIMTLDMGTPADGTFVQLGSYPNLIDEYTGPGGQGGFNSCIDAYGSVWYINRWNDGVSKINPDGSIVRAYESSDWHFTAIIADQYGRVYLADSYGGVIQTESLPGDTFMTFISQDYFGGSAVCLALDSATDTLIVGDNSYGEIRTYNYTTSLSYLNNWGYDFTDVGGPNQCSPISVTYDATTGYCWLADDFDGGVGIVDPNTGTVFNYFYTAFSNSIVVLDYNSGQIVSMGPVGDNNLAVFYPDASGINYQDTVGSGSGYNIQIVNGPGPYHLLYIAMGDPSWPTTYSWNTFQSYVYEYAVGDGVYNTWQNTLDGPTPVQGLASPFIWYT